jgi:hypothetical protein
MTFKLHLLFVLYLLVIYNAFEALRLRWRVQCENSKFVSVLAKEQRRAWVMLICGVVTLVAWNVFALTTYLQKETISSALLLWLAFVGLASIIVASKMWGAHKQYQLLWRRADRASAAIGNDQLVTLLKEDEYVDEGSPRPNVCEGAADKNRHPN